VLVNQDFCIANTAIIKHLKTADRKLKRRREERYGKQLKYLTVRTKISTIQFEYCINRRLQGKGCLLLKLVSLHLPAKNIVGKCRRAALILSRHIHETPQYWRVSAT
jgi:hypothetical protein